MVSLLVWTKFYDSIKISIKSSQSLAKSRLPVADGARLLSEIFLYYLYAQFSKLNNTNKKLIKRLYDKLYATPSKITVPPIFKDLPFCIYLF
jgi:hypothetical protein